MLKVTQQKTTAGVVTRITGETFDSSFTTENGTPAELLALAVEFEEKARLASATAIRVRCCIDGIKGDL